MSDLLLNLKWDDFFPVLSNSTLSNENKKKLWFIFNDNGKKYLISKMKIDDIDSLLSNMETKDRENAYNFFDEEKAIEYYFLKLREESSIKLEAVMLTHKIKRIKQEFQKINNEIIRIDRELKTIKDENKENSERLIYERKSLTLEHESMINEYERIVPELERIANEGLRIVQEKESIERAIPGIEGKALLLDFKNPTKILKETISEFKQELLKTYELVFNEINSGIGVNMESTNITSTNNKDAPQDMESLEVPQDMEAPKGVSRK